VPAIVLDGKALAAQVRQQVADVLKAAGSPEVCLATVLVGADRPSRSYVAMKRRDAGELGITSHHTDVPGDASQAEVEDLVRSLAADPAVHGILVQLPLPDGLDPDPVLDLVPAEKDVDGLTERSLGRLVRGLPGLVPCTPLGVLRLLEHHHVPTRGQRAVVLGRSTLVGIPAALLLARKGIDCTVTVAHSRTRDLADVVRQADIVVAAVGVAHIITPEMVKPGAAVLDVGVSRSEEGIVGDVDPAVGEVAGWLTPNPGGAGPMTRACLMENTLAAARLQGVLPPA
jgi:methylenetetrahydrofolate dehydrogenase (NADP+)/methenyltetrahydrofolate cyclohydrolase